jgi:hypothetical protein
MLTFLQSVLTYGRIKAIKSHYLSALSALNCKLLPGGRI